MRRLVSSFLVGLGMAAAGATGAALAAAPGHAGPLDARQAAAKPGKKVCTVTDERLDELSGMVAHKKGYIVVNDGSEQPGRNQIFFLNAKCQVTKEVPYSGNGPRDTEDIALSPDGKTLWIADIGDNGARRSSVAFWTMPADGSKKPVINRAVYPDGAHDAEALLINGDGTPIILTKEAGKARIYVPAETLKPRDSEGVPLKLSGEVKIPASTTSNPFSIAGRMAITGGAVAPDGSKALLRTYADAFEWDVTNGDVLAALKTTPRMTPLPDEPFGEAITYSADGRNLLTVSDLGRVDEKVPVDLLQYTPTASPAKPAQPGPAAVKAAGGPSWFDQLTLQDITYLIGGVGILGAVLVAVGIVGIVRARRRGATPALPKKPAVKDGGSGAQALKPAVDPDAETTLLAPIRDEPVPGPGASRRAGDPAGGVYGSGSGVYGGRPPVPPTAPAAGGVYGGPPSRVYGGGQYRSGADRDVQNETSARSGRNGYAPHGAGVYGRRAASGHGGRPDAPGVGGARNAR